MIHDAERQSLILLILKNPVYPVYLLFALGSQWLKKFAWRDWLLKN